MSVASAPSPLAAWALGGGNQPSREGESLSGTDHQVIGL